MVTIKIKFGLLTLFFGFISLCHGQDSLKVHLLGYFNGEKYKIFFSDRIVEIKTPKADALYSFYIYYPSNAKDIDVVIKTKSCLNFLRKRSVTIQINIENKKKYFVLFHDNRFKRYCFYDEWTDSPPDYYTLQKMGFYDSNPIPDRFKKFKTHKNKYIGIK